MTFGRPQNPHVIVELVTDHAPRSDGLVRYDDMAQTITTALHAIGIKVRVYPEMPLPR